MAVAWRWHLGDVADVGRIEPVADRGTESSAGWGNWSTPRTHSTPPPIYLWAAWRLLSTRSIDRDVPATAALERRLRRHIWMISPYTPPHTRTRWRQATTHRRIMCNTYANINPAKAPSRPRRNFCCRHSLDIDQDTEKILGIVLNRSAVSKDCHIWAVKTINCNRERFWAREPHAELQDSQTALAFIRRLVGILVLSLVAEDLKLSWNVFAMARDSRDVLRDASETGGASCKIVWYFGATFSLDTNRFIIIISLELGLLSVP